MIVRAAVGTAAAVGVALLARRAGSLSTSGTVAATIVGGIAASAGWNWAALLIGWFAASSAFTRLGHGVKAARTVGTLAPSSQRNARQVLANGGVFAAAAFLASLFADRASATQAAAPAAELLATASLAPTAVTAALSFSALGALAAAAADTWATEGGLLWGGEPRSVVSGARIEAGMSGGVTPAGLLASVAGALAVAVPGVLLVLPETSGREALLIAAVSTGGVLGGLADSILGATVQARRRCAACARWTERDVHDCGARTTHARGLRWMTNDTVNFITTLVGAGAAVLLVGALA